VGVRRGPVGRQRGSEPGGTGKKGFFWVIKPWRQTSWGKEKKPGTMSSGEKADDAEWAKKKGWGSFRMGKGPGPLALGTSM